jgi:uncharacterized membrane protein YoaK (UPF0700 family)
MAVVIPIDRRWLVAALLTLTAVTGLIDAVSYLRLGHVFVANMTGNVVFLGFGLLPGSGLAPLASAVSIIGFLAGALFGGRLGTRMDSRPRVWLGTALAVQAGVLAVPAVLGGIGVLGYTGHAALITIAALGASFGLQNATIRRLAAADLTTTVLTMALTGLAADSVVAGGPGAKLPRRLGSVLAMFAGAAVGALLLRITGPTGLIAIAAGVVAAIGILVAAAPAPRGPAPS